MAKAVTTIAVKDRMADVLNLGGLELGGKTELLKQTEMRASHLYKQAHEIEHTTATVKELLSQAQGGCGES